jgi:hypothetical protein
MKLWRIIFYLITFAIRTPSSPHEIEGSRQDRAHTSTVETLNLSLGQVPFRAKLWAVLMQYLAIIPSMVYFLIHTFNRR